MYALFFFFVKKYFLSILKKYISVFVEVIIKFSLRFFTKMYLFKNLSCADNYFRKPIFQNYLNNPEVLDVPLDLKQILSLFSLE